MQNVARQSGLDAVGAIPWGSHFCQFYNNEADLTETLVPYFEAGLRDGESCLWVTGHSLEAQKAEYLMTDAVPEFKKYISSGQMSIASISDWYKPGDVFNPDAVLQSWIDKEAESKARGFAGLRLSGDTIWVERSGWTNFMEYEKKVNASFRRYNLVALCTYCMTNSSASDVIDVCCNHQFALTRREGQWALLESASLKVAKDNLIRLNGELESRVESRTGELSAALRSRDEFLAMLGHELRNPLAPIRTASEVIRALTPADSPLAKSSQILYRQVGHLTRLVDDLLDVARVSQGHIHMDRQDTPLADILALAVEQSRPIIDQHLHSLSVTVLPRAFANRRSLSPSPTTAPVFQRPCSMKFSNCSPSYRAHWPVPTADSALASRWQSASSKCTADPSQHSAKASTRVRSLLCGWLWRQRCRCQPMQTPRRCTHRLRPDPAC